MAEIQELLASFKEAAQDPTAVLEAHLKSGKKVIGVGPYYIPEEIVYACGAIPFGVWGTVGSSDRAKKYFPPFYCSLCQTSLEMGLTHKLDRLSGMMITGLCDTLKAFSQNWKAGVTQVPMIFVSHPMNRKHDFGLTYAIDSYRDVKAQVQECCGAIVTDESLHQAIDLYNAWRKEMRLFLSLAGSRPRVVSISDRVAVVNSGYYLDKKTHLEQLMTLNVALASLPEDTTGFHRVVLSGIYEDIPAISNLLEEYDYTVVADDLAKESRALRIDVPDMEDPIVALAQAYCDLDGDSILFDPGKKHVDAVVEAAKSSDAEGVIVLLAKFCDPEEFDAPLVVSACRDQGIPVLLVEVDQSTGSYEQVRTQLETFVELL